MFGLEKKYLKEFILFPDVTIMGILFVISASFTAVHLESYKTWIAVVIGMLVYVTFEYLTHRFVFHLKPPKSPFFLKLLKRLHYDHHAKPNDLHLLFLPLWYSVPNIIVLGVIVYYITGSLVITNAVTTGLIIFFLYYEFVHYVAHRPIQPKSKWGRWMKKVHIWHHFKNENYWYGVTNPLGDVLMGTFEDQNHVEKSSTAKNLEARGEKIEM